MDGINDYTCKCIGEYTGKFCDISPSVALMYPQTSPCQHHECKNGICYQPNGSTNDYLCKCAPGYSGIIPRVTLLCLTYQALFHVILFTGKRCEYLTSLSFVHNTSFVELEPLRTKPDANVTVVFTTTQENGILLYDGHSEHLAVELFNSRIRVSYDVGNYPVSTMYRSVISFMCRRTFVFYRILISCIISTVLKWSPTANNTWSNYWRLEKISL